MKSELKYYSGEYYGNMQSNGKGVTGIPDIIVFRSHLDNGIHIRWEGYDARENGEWFSFQFNIEYDESNPDEKFSRRKFKPISEDDAYNIMFIGSI